MVMKASPKLAGSAGDTFYFLYKTTRFDGCYYIGVHQTTDLEDGYLGSGNRITNSINVHGKHAHTREIIEFFESAEKAYEREAEIVNGELIKDPRCMNLRTGGRGGFKHTPESCRRIGEASRGRKHSPESRAKISAGNSGKTQTLECRNKIRSSLTGIKHSEQRNIANRAARRTPEARARSAALKYKKCTVDGETIYQSKKDLIAALGHGKNGARSPHFHYV